MVVDKEKPTPSFCNVPAFSSSCCLFSSGRSDVIERVLGITCQQQDDRLSCFPNIGILGLDANIPLWEHI
ncbi:hypothetical protein T4E_8041 [Trichinella pseudospiralis]|uniref:Uncharacterized protein n=1 Tax=Trichinella pseudospiralis TaxID=6337 RepID=A0A0V0XFJ0_TRIPS|nr:hypothetical protein T4E_8041 [Trichinella pseudospiralis]